MRMTRLSGWGGLWMMGTALVAGCAQPQVRDVAFEVADIDLRGVDLAFHLDITNPLPLPIDIPGGRYALDIAGTPFLTSDQVPPASLAGVTGGRVTLPMRVQYADLLHMVAGLSTRNEVNYGLRGAMRVPLAGKELELPFSHNGSLPVLKVPTIAVNDVSVDGLTVAIDANLVNPNIFDLGLEQLGYSVNLGDLSLGRLEATTAGRVAAGQSGSLRLSGRLTAADAVSGLLGGLSPGGVHVTPVGSIRTPFGDVSLDH